MLETQSDFTVVGEASTGAGALALIARADPDVLLLDLEMPELDGVGVLQRMRTSGSRTRVIVFTVFDTDERIIAALAAGAAGYLLKGAPRRVRGDAPAAGPTLTSREQAVLEHLARGLGNKQIAAALGISERTVKFHVSSVFTKLGASNRTDAVARAAQAGLIKLQ
jgi:DNA-binding NarL/FixJ family response regulator